MLYRVKPIAVTSISYMTTFCYFLCSMPGPWQCQPLLAAHSVQWLRPLARITTALLTPAGAAGGAVAAELDS